jgi:hypothetical protein
MNLKSVVLDIGGFHKAAKLSIPKNIILTLLSPYSELKPLAEKIWQRIRNFNNRLHQLKSVNFSKFIDF